MDGAIETFRRNLTRAGFRGQMETEVGARHVAATDNSIYEVLPAAIAYPAELDDLNRIMKAGAATSLPLTARGGATGTNGQSLGDGVIVDCARNLNRILAIDTAGLSVTVEPGVVLDQLNAALHAHGLFFPPHVSTASRATIGGMVSTDASGKGSRIYGKTSDYIEALDLVLSDGSDWRAEPMTRVEVERIASVPGIVGAVHREALRIATEHAETIETIFPKMNRGLTGYNVQKVYDRAADRFHLACLLAGAEGTLALIKAIKLRVVRRPTHRVLAVVRYDDFDLALRDIDRLTATDPLAVEVLDDKIIQAAETDVAWSGVGDILGQQARVPIRALNFVEYAGFSEEEIAHSMERAASALATPAPGRVDHAIVRESAAISRLWSLREKAVGLLARLGEGRPGIPFVEDTAVPPHHLADYVADFRAILDSHGLRYGMFGHADVGCLHVRPLIDMKDPGQAALIRPISDAVASLTKRYGGLLWGEHGKGYRGEYSPRFFGDELYGELRRLKGAFDPNNLLNPGKLATPPGAAALTKIDSIPFRGAKDSAVTPALLKEFERSVACNGNGACFSWDAMDTMCPSYKASRDRAQSPKGRAALIRAWMRASAPETDEHAQIEDELRRSLGTCLSCKACTTLCPVKVDVPSMKSRFMMRYYRKRARPLRHSLLRHAETLFALGRLAPVVANGLARLSMTNALVGRLFGLVDIPRFLPPATGLAPPADVAEIQAMAPAKRARVVMLVEDSFTSSFDAGVVRDAAALLTRLGYIVRRQRARENGKVLYLLGLRELFEKVARARVRECEQLSQLGVRLVGLDAATMVMHEQEYREVTDSKCVVSGIESFMAGEIQAGRIVVPQGLAPNRSIYRLLGHCTETALRPKALAEWSTVLAGFGLEAKPVRVGCCGMAGLFGHERENRAMSQRLFDLSWRDQLSDTPETVLATGYSCRSQSLRFAAVRPRHPVELLASHVIRGGLQ